MNEKQWRIRLTLKIKDLPEYLWWVLVGGVMMFFAGDRLAILAGMIVAYIIAVVGCNLAAIFYTKPGFYLVESLAVITWIVITVRQLVVMLQGQIGLAEGLGVFFVSMFVAAAMVYIMIVTGKTNHA